MQVQIKLDASPQAQQTDEVAYVFSKCLNNYILLQIIIMLHIRFVMYWLFQQYICCSIKINSPQLMGKTRHKIMLKTR